MNMLAWHLELVNRQLARAADVKDELFFGKIV